MALDIITWSQLSGKASLVNGKVPSSQLPSYVDDIIEGYYYEGVFYEDAEHTHVIIGETGKIYLSMDTNIVYRYAPTSAQYIEISGGNTNFSAEIIEE